MAESRCRWQCPQQWLEWSEWLAAGLHGAHRWRLPVLLMGILFAHGRRTVTTWLRAVGISDDFDDYYYFLARIGRKSESVATQLLALVLANVPLPERLLAVIDDSPTKRYGPKVEGADIHRNPTPGPADQKYVYGAVPIGDLVSCLESLPGTRTTRIDYRFEASRDFLFDFLSIPAQSSGLFPKIPYLERIPKVRDFCEFLAKRVDPVFMGWEFLISRKR